MKYKVGDKVRIKSKEWYEKNKKNNGQIATPLIFNKEMSKYCGRIATIAESIKYSDGSIFYFIDICKEKQIWSEEMFDESINNQSETIKQRVIKVDIDTAKKWYKGSDESLKTLALQAFTIDELKNIELPNTWEEFCDKNKVTIGESYVNSTCEFISHSNIERNYEKDKNYLPNREYAKGILALCQLTQLRDCYRQGWKPDWVDSTNKHIIDYGSNELRVSYYMHSNCFLSFQSTEIRDKFLNNFRDLIELAKEYI